MDQYFSVGINEILGGVSYDDVLISLKSPERCAIFRVKDALHCVTVTVTRAEDRRMLILPNRDQHKSASTARHAYCLS